MMKSMQCIKKSDNMEIVINDEPDEVIKNFLIDSKKDIKILWNR